MSDWIQFSEIDLDDETFDRFNIDTRDFHCSQQWLNSPHPDWKTISKYDHFFYTKEEVIENIKRLYEESGGEGKWRCLYLMSHDVKVLNWNLKYIRIWRTEKGFMICNSENQAISKEALSCPVDKEVLGFH